MKTVAEIAREIGVSKQAVHKKIKQEPLKSSLGGLTKMIDNSLRFDTEGESLVKSAFRWDESTTKVVEMVDNATTAADESANEIDETSKSGGNSSTLGDEASSKEIITILKDEISLLISQNEDLRRQLNDERAHNRELTDKMLPLIEQAQKITENAQTLHAIVSVKPQLTDGKEKSLWKRLFSRGKE